jgi:hypothetical protein
VPETQVGANRIPRAPDGHLVAFGGDDVDEPTQRLHTDDIVGLQPAHVDQQTSPAVQRRSEAGAEDLGEGVIQRAPEDDDDAPPVGTDLHVVMEGFGDRHLRSVQDRRHGAVPPMSQVRDDAR